MGGRLLMNDVTTALCEKIKRWQADEHAIIEVDNDRWALKIERDDIPASRLINDAGCWGKVSKYAYDYSHDSREPRPKEFTGAARKIQVDRGYWMWWEPYREEGGKVYDDADSFNEVRRLLEEGFLGVTVILQRRCDCCGQLKEVGRDSLWGIDSLENGYGATVVGDLVDEILATTKKG